MTTAIAEEEIEMKLSSVIRTTVVAGSLVALTAFGNAPATLADVEGPREEYRYLQADIEGPREEPRWFQADVEGPREEYRYLQADIEGPREEILPGMVQG
jgi:hypothetical protein